MNSTGSSIPSFSRPPTPLPLHHTAPLPTLHPSTTPSKYLILISAPTSVAGKVQIATQVSQQLSCPLFQGDSLHESAAKAATVGKSEDGGRERYKRMWFAKMVRTGLLFPDEALAVFQGLVGDGGGKRGSGSSVESLMSESESSFAGSQFSEVSSTASDYGAIENKPAAVLNGYVNPPISAHSRIDEEQRRANPALMVLTHPEMKQWHQDMIRDTLKPYDIGVVFVPLFRQEMERELKDLPVLQPLTAALMSGLQSFDELRARVEASRSLEYGHGRKASLKEEILLRVDVDGVVEDIIEEIVTGVKNIMAIS